jgi:hypothetical protein
MVAYSAAEREQWKEKILQQQKSGLTAEQWCKENHVKTHILYYWKNIFFPKNISHNHFVELVENNKPMMSIEYKGVVIHIDKNFDQATLQKCLKILGVKC